MSQTYATPASIPESAPQPRKKRAWSVALVVGGLGLTVVWTSVLGYGLITLILRAV